jgi:hypothetical protein
MNVIESRPVVQQHVVGQEAYQDQLPDLGRSSGVRAVEELLLT